MANGIEKVKVRCHGCAKINLLLVKIEAPGTVLALSEAERFECAWCGQVHQPGYEFWLIVEVARP